MQGRRDRGAPAFPRSREPALGRERTQSVLTRLLASAARLGADTAMLVMVRVPLTLVGTPATRLNARLHNSAREFRHELRLPAQNSSGRNADVAAVLTRGDAAQLLLHVRLTQAGVSACRAALRAVEARVDARDQRGGVYLNGSWMRLQHLLSVGHLHLRPRFASAWDLSVELRVKPGARLPRTTTRPAARGGRWPPGRRLPRRRLCTRSRSHERSINDAAPCAPDQAHRATSSPANECAAV
jgi:hypothetical protein